MGGILSALLGIYRSKFRPIGLSNHRSNSSHQVSINVSHQYGTKSSIQCG